MAQLRTIYNLITKARLCFVAFAHQVKMSALNVSDVSDPKIDWVGESCYRVNIKHVDLPTEEKPQQQLRSYDDNEEINCGEQNDFDIEVTENGRFKTIVQIPRTFFPYIIGTKGSRRKKLEEETKTDISVPKQAKSNRITITGPTELSVAVARRKLEMIDLNLRNKHQITHFISFPLISDEIKDNMKKFKEQVLALGHIDGLDETIFQNVNKIHLTIGVLVLLDDNEKENAAEVLEKFRKDVLEPRLRSREGKPLIINMKGLDYMNDDPAQVDVLYAKVRVTNDENSNILQEISDKIVDYFYKQGLMKKDHDHVKLHATIINTRYKKTSSDDSSGSRSRDSKRRNFKRIAFDARPVLEKFADFDFGTQKLDVIHLSHRFSVDENGYYEAVHAISCI